MAFCDPGASCPRVASIRAPYRLLVTAQAHRGHLLYAADGRASLRPARNRSPTAESAQRPQVRPSPYWAASARSDRQLSAAETIRPGGRSTPYPRRGNRGALKRRRQGFVRDTSARWPWRSSWTRSSSRVILPQSQSTAHRPAPMAPMVRTPLQAGSWLSDTSQKAPFPDPAGNFPDRSI
jgi:hypothetical protein